MSKSQKLLDLFVEEDPKNPNGTPDVHGAYLEKMYGLAGKYLALETELMAMAMAEHFKMEPGEILAEINDYNNDEGSKLSILMKSERN